MALTIYLDNSVAIDGVKTGLKVIQTGQRTLVYLPEYQEIQMPHPRYSLTHDTPASGTPGKIQFETDIRRFAHHPSA